MNYSIQPGAGVNQCVVHDLRSNAIALHREGLVDKAIQLYTAYLKHQARDAGIWGNLGVALRSQGRLQAALRCSLVSLQIDSSCLGVLGNFGNILKDLHHLEESLAVHRRVLQGKPHDVRVLMNLACSLRESRQFTQALDTLNQAQLISPESPDIEWERAQNLLYLGRYREGFAAYEARWRISGISHADYGCPRWQGESLRNRRIVLHAEQGFGDTIFAARYVPLVKALGGEVIVECQAELVSLFADIGADQVIPRGRTLRSCDYHCPMMSLMGRFATRLETIPPPVDLQIPEPSRQKFAHLSHDEPGALKVGIVWSGSVTFKNNTKRSVSIDDFLPLAKLPAVRLYSLQQGPRASELDESRANSQITDLAPQCADFADTAAAIENLDVIVMTDSSVAHLAGSMGVPVINLLQYVPYWIYCNGEENSTPWYPSHHLIRQVKSGDWASVFLKAKGILRKMAGEKLLACSVV